MFMEKKKMLRWFFCGFFLLLWFPIVTLANDGYTDEVKNAGFSYEQYQQIMQIPNMPDEKVVSTRATYSLSQQESVVNLALQYRGVPYVWGGTSPAGFDCSGLVQYVYKHAVNISLPRVTYDQEKMGSEVSLNSLQKGDLLFWGSRGQTYHVAMYIGNNQYIHAPQPGEVVKVANMSSWRPNFARRILATTPEKVTAGNLDTFKITAREITVGGWHIASDASAGPYSYIFIMDADTGRELSRHKINRTVRNDVAATYSNVKGAQTSGFYVTIPIPAKALGKNIKIMSRYAKEANGNNEVSDYTYPVSKKLPTRMNTGNLDRAVVTKENNLELSGWHLTNYADWNTFRMVILIDTATGKEIKRQSFVSVARPDVARVYPDQIFGGNCGFKVSIPIGEFKGKKIKVISRYALDANGANIIEDYLFSQVIQL